MAWYFNFCAPTIPNDSAINFHRRFQSAQLATLMMLFVIYYTYYKLWGPDHLTSIEEEYGSGSKFLDVAGKNKRQKNQSKSNSQKQQNKMSINEDKKMSITQKIKNGVQQNESYAQLKRTGLFLKKKTFKQKQTLVTKKQASIKVSVTAHEIEKYFPIVFGHHAIAMGASIMYSPYAQQSIASIVYVLCSFLLAIVNSKRMRKTTYGVWIFMAFLNVFIMISAVLSIGQSNWDLINKMCFAEQYTSLY